MERIASDEMQTLKDVIIQFLSASEIHRFEESLHGISERAPSGGEDGNMLRPISEGSKIKLANIFKMTAIASHRAGEESRNKLNKALRGLAEKFVASELVDFLHTLLIYAEDNFKTPEIPKSRKDMSQEIDQELGKIICYLRILNTLMKVVMNRLSCEESEMNLNAVKECIASILLAAHRSTKVPRSSEFKDVCVLQKENLQYYSQLVENYLSFVGEVLHFGLEDREGGVGKVMRYVLKKSALHVVPLGLLSLGSNQDWTRKNSRKQAETTLKTICKLSNSRNLEALLVGADYSSKCDEISSSLLLFPQGLLGAVLRATRSGFDNEGWKQDPTLKHVLLCGTMNVKYPNLKAHIAIIVSMLLEMVEDYLCENQILGIGCLQHLIENVNPSDLNLYNHAAVIYDTLFKQLYGTKNATLQVLLPCLLKILKVLEPFGERINVDVTSKWDQVTRKIITNLEYENKVPIRRSLARNLKSFVACLGVNSVKHLSSLLRLAKSCLEFHDGEDEDMRISTLEFLKETVVACWPVILDHVGEIIKVILRLVVDINFKGSFTSKKAIIQLEQLALEIVLFLKVR